MRFTSTGAARFLSDGYAPLIRDGDKAHERRRCSVDLGLTEERFARCFASDVVQHVLSAAGPHLSLSLWPLGISRLSCYST